MFSDLAPSLPFRLNEQLLLTVYDNSFTLVSLLALLPALWLARTWIRAIALAVQLFGIASECIEKTAAVIC